MKDLKSFFVFILILWMNTSTAGVLSDVYVFSEQDDKNNEDCRVSNRILKSAAESVLRYNQISMTNNRNAELSLYVNSYSIPIEKNICASTLQIQFYKLIFSDIPGTQKVMMGEFNFCSQNFLGWYGKNVLQEKLIAETKNLVEFCISKIEEKAK